MENEPILGPDWHRGVIFQSPTLYPWLNVQDNIGFGLRMREFPKKEIEELTNRYLELVGLKGFERHKPYELSGGMKQRASLARILVNNPRMLLMDEPFGSLDFLTRQNMQTLIREIWTKTENTVFLNTHDVDEALALATRIIIMSSRPGRILKEFQTSFTYQISGMGHEKARYTPEYMELREEILNIINSQDEALNFSQPEF
jgi:taurine transport system ATP-binding protein